jgi:hypothetical protein
MLKENKVKKILFVLLALGFVACTAEEKKEMVPKVMCSADCSGSLAGNPEYRCDLYDSREFQEGSVTCEYNQESSTCEVITTSCIEIPPALEFQACVGVGQGNCDEGLDCYSIDPQTSVCMTTCLADNECRNIEGGPGICIATNMAGHCFKRSSQINEVCGWDNYSLCAEDQGRCTATTTNLISSTTGSGFSGQEMVDFRCKPICDPSGTDSYAVTCGASEECIPSPTGIIKAIESVSYVGTPSLGNDINDYRPCDAENTDPAQCSVGFQCTPLRFRDGTSGGYCTLFEHWCGKSAVFCDAFDRVGMVRCAQQNPCNTAPEYDMCAVTGATDTPANTDCWGSYKIDGNELYPMCVAVCENQGIKNAAGDDLKELDCGPGYICKAPEAGKELNYTHQSAVDSTYTTSATCEIDSECDTARGFSCLAARQNNPKSCNRPTKMCIVE